VIGLATILVVILLGGWVLLRLNKLTLRQDEIFERLEALERAVAGRRAPPA
jgi:flagellar biogenesis protein FliO